MKSHWLERILEPIYRKCAKVLVHIVYRISYEGIDHLPDEGPGLLIANHVSYMDGILIHAATKRRVRFVIDEHTYNIPFVHHFMSMDEAIPIAANKHSVQRALDEISMGLEQGDLICIFPSGQITYTGHLGHFKPGVEWIIERDPVPVYPVAIKGMWGSIWSRKYIRARYRFFPRSFRRRVKVVFGPAIPPEACKVRYLQQVILDMLYEMH